MSNRDAARLWCEKHLARNGSLQRDGVTWLCSSPLREDHEPSLSVDIQKRCFKDHGTKEHGTLTELAESMGVEAPEWDGGESHEGKNSPARTKPDTSSAAVKLWGVGRPATSDHLYLAAKCVDPFDMRVAPDGRLLVPGYESTTGAFRMVQTIAAKPDESDKWPKRDTGPVKGSFWLVGNDKGADGSSLVIAEGPATAASVKAMFPEMAVVCSFGTANLETVYAALRNRFPEKEIVIASDSGTEDLAAKCAGALAVIPSAAQSNYDWNDAMLELGQEEAKRQFGQKLESTRTKAPKKPSLRSLRSTLAPERGVKPEMIGGIFPRGGVSILAGQQGSGKSLFMQKFCSDVSLGGEILSGVSPYAVPRKVVFFVGELPEDTMNDRARTTIWPFNVDNFVLYNRIEAAKKDITFDLTDAEGFKNIVEIIRDEKPDLVVFDSFMSFNTCDESDMKTMQAVFSKLVRLAGEEKVAVVLVHHIRKRKSVERQCRLHMDDIIGSSIITRNASVAIGLEAMKQDDGTETVYVSSLKTWYAPLDEFAFSIVRDEYKVLRGIEIDLEPKSPAANKTEAIRKAVFGGHADGSEFTVAGISTLTGSTVGYVRRLFREWEEKDMIESRGGSKNTSYSIMQKYRNHIQTLANTEKDSGTEVPESTGIHVSPSDDSGTDSRIPVLAVPESFPVIPTAEDPFRYKPMIPGEENPVPEPQSVETPKGKQSSLPRVSLDDGRLFASLLPDDATPGASTSAAPVDIPGPTSPSREKASDEKIKKREEREMERVFAGSEPDEGLKDEEGSPSRGYPLSAVPADVALPCRIDDGSGRGERWLLRWDVLGNGTRLFHTSKSKSGRADWSFPEPEPKGAAS